MAPVATTYSFKDLVGTLTNPLIDTLQIVGGNIGVGTITIRMLTERSAMETAADGVVMPSYIPGESAEVTVEMLQTSELHHAFLALFNLLASAANGGDVSNVFASVLSFRTLLDGSGHLIRGTFFDRIADKPYAAKGQMVTWKFIAANAVNQ